MNKRRVKTSSPRLPLAARGERLRRADRSQAAAGRRLREASDLCLSGTIDVLDSLEAFGRIGFLLAQAKMHLLVARELHNRQVDQFIEWVMKPQKGEMAGKGKKGRGA